jgi:hypothetical protein
MNMALIGRVTKTLRGVAARDQHGAAEILLEARSEHEAEQDRRRVECRT